MSDQCTTNPINPAAQPEQPYAAIMLMVEVENDPELIARTRLVLDTVADGLGRPYTRYATEVGILGTYELDPIETRMVYGIAAAKDNQTDRYGFPTEAAAYRIARAYLESVDECGPQRS